MRFTPSSAPLPVVTVVTVCRNVLKAGRKEMVLQCVESVRCQTYPRMEHLIIDGASTDGTVEWLVSLNLTVLSEKDTGIYDAMNKGVLRAKGDYVVFLNTDDFFHHPSGIEESVRALLASGADYSYAGQTIYWNEACSCREVRNAAYGKLLYRMPFCHQSMLCRRDVLLREGLFDARFKSSGDYDLIVRLFLKHCRAVKVGCCFVTFRIGGESSKNQALSQREMVDVFEKNYAPYVKKTREQWARILKTGVLPLQLIKLLPRNLRWPQMVRNGFLCLKAVRRDVLRVRLRKGTFWVQLLGRDIVGDSPYTSDGS